MNGRIDVAMAQSDMFSSYQRATLHVPSSPSKRFTFAVNVLVSDVQISPSPTTSWGMMIVLNRAPSRNMISY